MFSGIVRGTGRIVRQVDAGGDRRMTVALEAAKLAPPSVGASVAVNGVCLTATECHEDRFSADVSAETLAVTTLGNLPDGAPVNLEPSLQVGDSLDGHWVAGHVDGIGRVVWLEPRARSTRICIELPAPLLRYVARKGSIAVDGTSLTVNAVQANRFEVNVIPLTAELTVISEYRPGTAVNIEVDIIARYLERLATEGKTELSYELLQEHGYIGKH